MVHAVRIHKTGGPEVMVLEDIPLDAPGPEYRYRLPLQTVFAPFFILLTTAYPLDHPRQGDMSAVHSLARY